MMKHTALVIGVVMVLGAALSPVMADCTESDVHNEVAEWAGVPTDQATDDTQLDGLGGRSWPEDAPPLINEIEAMCGCNIPADQYETFDIIDDIDDCVGVDDPKN